MYTYMDVLSEINLIIIIIIKLYITSLHACMRVIYRKVFTRIAYTKWLVFGFIKKNLRQLPTLLKS